MTESTDKSRRLADWQERLDGPVAVDQLDAWNAELRNEVDQMKAVGLIDPEEAHDLRELADAAYSHHVEDALTRELNS
ncbi:hypothetical protein KVG88_30205 [Pseudomonas sp. SWRI74]|uniref:Uncharacterized protein n=1 Tax=Pseudomonas azerbaijanoccidentalis TaxID=2842347 RepID=A0ABS6QZN8_9PSED|nr:hypothetical protein [Pseudomonas azerbaijanoccidentalis]MBV4524349.1 hypothetical protein [Pseudomonas azerbaijanoccidentalis]